MFFSYLLCCHKILTLTSPPSIIVEQSHWKKPNLYYLLLLLEISGVLEMNLFLQWFLCQEKCFLESTRLKKKIVWRHKEPKWNFSKSFWVVTAMFKIDSFFMILYHSFSFLFIFSFFMVNFLLLYAILKTDFTTTCTSIINVVYLWPCTLSCLVLRTNTSTQTSCVFN